MGSALKAEWIEEELAGIDLGDQRLNKRCRRVLERLAADPQASINGACHGWAETHAAYQFFDNDAVDEDRVLAPHRQATLQRMKSFPVVLLVQDTTELDYTRIKKKLSGAGPLDKPYRRGFYNHVQVAFTPQRLCLGVVSMRLWARDDETFDTCKQRKHTPLEEKESYRWLEAYRNACQIAEELPTTQIVSISDREGDIYECFLEAQQAGPPRRADWIIRASANRNLPKPDPETGSSCYCKLFDAIAEAPVLGKRIVRVPKTPKHKARKAKVTVRAQCIRLKAPYRAGGRLPEIAINVVLVKEETPPEGEEPLVWLLLTSLPIDRLAAALRVVDYYACRWQIEVYFRVLKVGCKVEEIQLEAAERLRPCLALYEIVAWRVLYVTMLGREAPELPCSVLFTDEEWKSAWMISTDKAPPSRPPRLKVFLPLLAELGGYNGREHDGPPGPKALWIAIRRMTDFALAWSTFGPKGKTYV
jgi:Transposase DNA-binding/Transposase Tn5 dimerisation domain